MENRDKSVTVTSEDYESQVKRKKWGISQNTKKISDLLHPILPKFSDAESSSKFHLFEDFRPCERQDSTLPDAAHFIRSDDPNRQFLSMNLFGLEQYKTDTQSTIRTHFVKRVYQGLMNFLDHNDNEDLKDIANAGFGQNFTIHINSSSEALLELYVKYIDNEEYKSLVLDTSSKLKQWFDNNETDCNLVSLVVMTYSKNELRKAAQYGSPYLTETVCGLKFLISGSYLCSWHPSGMKVLSEALLELAKLNEKSGGVVQIGCISAVPTLLMAKVCKKLAVVDPNQKVGQLLSTNAVSNNIHNITHCRSNLKDLRNDFLDQNFRQCGFLCVVIYKLDVTEAAENFLKRLRSYSKVKKIIYVSTLKNLDNLKTLASCCQKESEDKDGFVVTKAVPVDTSPFQTDVHILYLLEREFDSSTKVCVENTLEAKIIPVSENLVPVCEKPAPVCEKPVHVCEKPVPINETAVPVSEVKEPSIPLKQGSVKELSAVKQADLISSILMPFLPKLIKDCEPNRTFHLETLHPCPSVETLSDALEVHTDVDQSTNKLEMKYTTSMYGKSVPVTSITSDLIRKVYEHLIGYMGKTNIPLYNPTTKTGFWKNLVIRMNHSGEVLVIVGYHKEHLTRSDSCDAINSALKLNVMMTLGMRGCKVTSLLVKTYESTGCSVKCLLGPNVLFEEINDFKISVCDRPFTLVNQHAIAELSHSIADVAQINSSTTILQIGAGYDATTLYLSKLSKQFYMICNEITVGNNTAKNAELNKIENFTFYSKGMPEKTVYELLQDVLSELSEEDNICALLYEFSQGPGDDIQKVLMAKNVKKVLFMAEVDIETQIRKLVSFCHGDDSPFIITKAIPIDISPNGENVKMIYLLERESLITNSVEENKEFTPDSVTSLLKESKGFSLENIINFHSKEGSLILDDKKSSDNSNHVPQKNVKPVSDSTSVQKKSVTHNISKPPMPFVQSKQVNRHNIPPEANSNNPPPFVPFQANLNNPPPFVPFQGNLNNPQPPFSTDVNPAHGAGVKNPQFSLELKPFTWDRGIQWIGDPKEDKEPKGKVKGRFNKSKKKRKKRFGPNFVHDDWFIDMGVEDHFRIEICTAIHENRIETNEDYENQLRLKQMFAMAQAKLISDVLQPAFPVIAKRRSQKILFYMEPMRAPYFIKSESREFHVVVGIDPNTGEPSMTFEYYSSYKPLPVRPFNSPLIECAYKHIMNVISRSELKLFNCQNNRSGFWKRISMKVNNVGKVYIVIDAYSMGCNAEALSVKAVEELDSYFNTEAKGFPIGNIVLKVKNGSITLITRMMSTNPVRDIINGFNVTLCEDIILWQQYPAGLEVLSNAISELGQLDKTTVLVQIGLHDGITIMSLSKVCKQLFVLFGQPDCTVQHHLKSNAAENNIKNISFHRTALTHEYVKNLLTKSSLKWEQNICVLVQDFTVTEKSYHFKSDLLQDIPNVRKVMFLSERRTPHELRSVYWLCRENRTLRDSAQKVFIITRVIPVDLSPYESNVKLLCLLERAGDLPGQIEANKGFDEIKVQKFEEIEKIENFRVRFSDEGLEREKEKRISAVKELSAFQKPPVLSYSQSTNYVRNLTAKVESRNTRVNVMPPFMNKMPPNMNQMPPNMNQMPPNMNQMPPNMNQMPPNMSQMPPNMNQMPPNMNQMPPNMNQMPPNMYQMPPSIYQMPPNMNQMPPSVNQVPPSMPEGISDLQPQHNIDRSRFTYIRKGDSGSLSVAAIQNPVENREIRKSNSEMNLPQSFSGGSSITAEKRNELSEKLYQLKKTEVFKSLKVVSDTLRTSLSLQPSPSNFGLIFQLSNLKPCPMISTQCGKLQALSGVNPRSGCVDMILQDRNWDIQGAVIYCDKMRYLYDKILGFMKSSPYELYNPDKKTGFWHSVYIAVNDVGEAMLVVKSYVCEFIEGIEQKMAELSARMTNCFVPDAAQKLLVSLVFRICYLKMTKVKVLIGDEYLNYNIGPFKIQVFENTPLISNPYGLELLGDTLVEVADLNQSYKVLQLGSRYDLLSVKLAKQCQKIFVLDPDKKIGHRLLTNMGKNNLSNLRFFAEDGSNKPLYVLENEMEKNDNVCIVVFGNLLGITGDIRQTLMSDLRIKKILLVSEHLDSCDVKILVTLHEKSYYCTNPFIIKRVVPVDMCPYSTCVQMVHLLVRKFESDSRTIPSVPCVDEPSRKVTDRNYPGEKINVFQAGIPEGISPAKYIQSAMSQVSGESHFERKRELQGNPDRDKHGVEEHFRSIPSNQPQISKYQDSSRDTGIKRIHEPDEYDALGRHFKSQKYDDARTSSQVSNFGYENNYRGNSDLLARKSEVFVDRGREAPRIPSEQVGGRKDPIIHHYDHSSRGREPPRDPNEHLNRTNDPIIHRYDDSGRGREASQNPNEHRSRGNDPSLHSGTRYNDPVSGYGKPQSALNVNDPHFNRESFLGRSNAPESRDTAPYTSRSHMVSDTGMRTGPEVSQRSYYDSDTSNSQRRYGNVEDRWRPVPSLSERSATEFGRPQEYDRWEYEEHSRRKIR